MRHLALALVLFALIVGSLSCEGVFFASSNGVGVLLLTTSGTVSIVQLTVINGCQVTVVTLLNTGQAQTFNFCGNVVGQFPYGAFVTVTFTKSSGCNSVSQVR